MPRLPLPSALIAGLSGLSGLLAVQLADATTAYYRFESSLVADSSGNGYDLSSPADEAPDRLARAAGQPGEYFFDPVPQTEAVNAHLADFDGSERLLADNSGGEFVNDVFTIEALVHLDASSTGTQVIAGVMDSSIARGRSWYIGISNGKFRLYLCEDGASDEVFTAEAPGSIAAGKDYYLAARVDLPGNFITLNVKNLTDDSPIASQNYNPGGLDRLFDSPADFSIGATANPSMSSPFNGRIDEVRYTASFLSMDDLLITDPDAPMPELPFADGFRGIWYSNQATGDQYAYKYSGGMATYPQQHVPIAIYAPEANKTFFVLGGTDDSNDTLLHLISCYDHATGQVARPRILVDKQTTDAHDNPVLSIDADGHLWVFSNTHGEAPRASRIFRSTEPYDISRFTEIDLPNDVFPSNRFNYGQPWFFEGHGFLLLHTRYVSNNRGREIFATNSPDGYTWSARRELAAMPVGQYQISHASGDRLVTALNYHPDAPEGEFNARTNLYYMESTDYGHTWKTAGGQSLSLPLDSPSNPALIRDYEDEGKLVYLKNITLTPDGQPVILYLLVDQGEFNPGPGPVRELHTARWDGTQWIFRPAITTNHNYDFGFLHVEASGQWRLTGPFLDGPQNYGTGGEVGIWTSDDQGANWTLERQVTASSPRNHTYLRHPLHARDDFYAIWADGDAFGESVSHIYFADKHGDAVYRLPETVSTDWVTPELVTLNGPDEDPDGDGQTVAEEVEAGTDPRDPGSRFQFLEALQTSDGHEMSFATKPGREYKVQYRDELEEGDWQDLTAYTEGDGSEFTVTDADSAPEGRRFYRICVRRL